MTHLPWVGDSETGPASFKLMELLPGTGPDGLVELARGAFQPPPARWPGLFVQGLT